MFILGLSATEHDTAAALIDGQGLVVAAIEEGKLARSRTLGGAFQNAAIRYCMERAGNRLGRHRASGCCESAWPLLEAESAFSHAARAALSNTPSAYYYLNEAFWRIGATI